MSPQSATCGQQLSCSLRLWAKLDDFSELRLSHRPQRFPKVLRHVKLNHFCHDNLLDPRESPCERLGQIVRSPLLVAISAVATFISAMIRTSCSVKPRVVIFHISASNSSEACLCGEFRISCVRAQGQIG